MILRRVTSSDIDVLHRIWTDPDVRRFLWDDEVIDREVAAAVVAASDEDWRERSYGLFVVSEEGEDIGFVGFRSSDEDERPELLFGILPGWWHRGIATNAAKKALAFIFETHGEVWAATDPPNVASVRVMERIGMTFERRGTLNGLDTVFYSIRRTPADDRRSS